ncbi:DUF11 domain-containing protein [Micromonospora sp. A3M-1-15]|uniref:DUF11 domain-containing protein n=1 Tax=Micromonospora sp. A3M-1-15 TaxID=2962035 RepID=UPI0020B7E1F8|nr:DUF11 domain-containing protein [Micromonospora sp. A3M-1-15]MCP3786865.1 DUF11 domain-containing protein [Micromonospora sp. A3M-1-15]
MSTTNAKGRVGDTVSIRVTVANHGPAVEPEWALTGVETQPGTRFVSGTGCSPDPDGGQYCPGPGPLAVGASQTIVLRYKIIRTVPHPEWQSAGFGLYEALARKGGTDDVDLNFQIYILGSTATPATRAPARASATPTRSTKASARPSRPSATPPSSPPSASASPSAAFAAPGTEPAPRVSTATMDTARSSGFTAGWAAGTSGIAIIGVGALIAAARRRRRRAEPVAAGPADDN